NTLIKCPDKDLDFIIQGNMSQRLRQAVKFEKEIALFYLEKGAGAENLLVQKLFLELAKQEIDHLGFIQAMVQTSSQTTLPGNNLETAIKDFFTRFQPELLKKEATSTQALVTAMELEKAGLAMYQQFLQAATGEEKELFDKILAYEQQHLASLENVHFYLTGTGDWWQQDESRRWNWMNT
ncbi:MAG TPA: ferritin family protein, partial [bacterium]|nr:ferritin family protein [bacterium]HOL66356.1 ferritin family protein [bacterium]